MSTVRDSQFHHIEIHLILLELERFQALQKMTKDSQSLAMLLVLLCLTTSSYSFRMLPMKFTHQMNPTSTISSNTALNVFSLDNFLPWGKATPKEVVADDPNDREHLIDEEMVTDDLSASLLADRCIDEAKRLFTSKKNWKKIDINDHRIEVDTIPLDGGYRNSGVHLVRGVGIIPASAEKFFNFQCSREGYQSIDEYLVNHRNVENFKWVTHPEFNQVEVPPAGQPFAPGSPYQLMMSRVEWKYPIKRREFVALDIVHRDEMILISKSALSPKRPGGSKYQNIVPLDETTPYVDPIDPVARPLVRAVQYYASKVEPIDDKSCKLTMVTWGEMCDSYSAWWVNLFNAHVFITPKFDRFIRVMEGEKVFEESKIMDNAWRLIQIIPNLKPDAIEAASSDFVRGKKVV